MNGPDLEQEVKFWVPDLDAFRLHLEQMGAEQVHPRVAEYNLRLDTPDRALQRAKRVLRLRRDVRQTLTYKGPPLDTQGVRVRTEIEVEVGDLDAARRLLEALGFQTVLVYEKYRTTYRWRDVFITLDEMPYGTFVEIEGPSPDAVAAAARALNLDMTAAIPESYAALFARLKAHYHLPFRDLTFANFAEHAVDLRALNLRPAWKTPK